MNELNKKFLGKWTYRSFLNDSEIYEDPKQFMENIIWGQGILEITEVKDFQIAGNLKFGEKYILDIKGRISFGSPSEVRFVGIGQENTDAKGWIYDYHGYLAPLWPTGIDQKTTMTGTVIRTISHSNGNSKAGVNASFISVKHT